VHCGPKAPVEESPVSEKTEEATPKRKRKARQEGDVAKSPEFTGVTVLLAALAATVITGHSIAGRLLSLFERSIALASRPQPDPSLVGPFLMESLRVLALILAPILAAAFALAAFISYIQIGPIFTIKPLIPDAKKLDAIEGLKNLFNKDKAVELVKNVLKLTLMGAIGYATFFEHLAALVRTPRLQLADAFVVFRQGAMELTGYLVGGLVGFAVFDFFWKRHSHAKKMRMSKDEVKREHKESEGDPMIKSQREALHRQMINEAGMKRVSDADVVVVNPTHVAVALRYREEEARAPQVVSRGRGEVAREIKKLARRHRVPIVHNVGLARSLVELELEEEIPQEFYEPVAEILRFAYELGRE
jgi:flagellar biosynthetic protein FlhB